MTQDKTPRDAFYMQLRKTSDYDAADDSAGLTDSWCASTQDLDLALDAYAQAISTPDPVAPAGEAVVWQTVPKIANGLVIDSIRSQLECDTVAAQSFWDKLLYWATEYPTPPAGEVIAWQRRICTEAGKWLHWEYYHDEERPETVGRWKCEYRALGVITPPALRVANEESVSSGAVTEELSGSTDHS